jgi:hypothetical protein
VQRKRIQSQPRRPKNTTRKSSSKKPPVALSEMVLNWVIVILAGVILVFLASTIWRVFVDKSNRPEAETPTEQTEAVQEVIRVEVLNGCGESGIAGLFTDYLRSQGFDVVNTGNYSGGFNVDSSFVLDRRSMRKTYGDRVAESLGIRLGRVKPVLSEEMDLEATLVLGKDCHSLNGYSGN